MFLWQSLSLSQLLCYFNKFWYLVYFTFKVPKKDKSWLVQPVTTGYKESPKFGRTLVLSRVMVHWSSLGRVPIPEPLNLVVDDTESPLIKEHPEESCRQGVPSEHPQVLANVNRYINECGSSGF